VDTVWPPLLNVAKDAVVNWLSGLVQCQAEVAPSQPSVPDVEGRSFNACLHSKKFGSVLEMGFS